MLLCATRASCSTSLPHLHQVQPQPLLLLPLRSQTWTHRPMQTSQGMEEVTAVVRRV